MQYPIDSVLSFSIFLIHEFWLAHFVDCTAMSSYKFSWFLFRSTLIHSWLLYTWSQGDVEEKVGLSPKYGGEFWTSGDTSGKTYGLRKRLVRLINICPTTIWEPEVKLNTSRTETARLEASLSHHSRGGKTGSKVITSYCVRQWRQRPV
jgi:hypothetical protein